MEISEVVVLRRSGMFVRSRQGEHAFEPRDFVPRWRNGFTVEQGATLGDFLNVLRSAPSEVLDIIDGITFSNTRPFLREARLPSNARETELVGISVSAWVTVDSLTAREPNPELGDHDCGSQVTVTGFDSTGDAYCLEVPVYTLVDLPIFVSRLGELRVNNAPAGTFSFSLTLGEFTQVLLDAICFSGTPEARDDMFDEILRAYEQALADQAAGKLKRWDSW